MIKTIAKSKQVAIPRMNRWLALCAIAGPILFTLAWLLLGFFSPGYTLFGTHIAPYSVISQPVSGLGLGVTAIPMNISFVLSGVLIMMGVVGIFKSIPEMSHRARLTSIILLALTGLGCAWDGIFTLESFFFHFLGFGLVLTTIFSFLIVGLLLRRILYWRKFGNWLLLGSPLTLILSIIYFTSFNPTTSGAGLGIAGLTERVLIMEILGWYVVMGWLAFRRRSS